MHLAITPAQYKKLNAMGRKGGGSIPQAFDPDDWDEIKSVVDIPVYVAKGKGHNSHLGPTMLQKSKFPTPTWVPRYPRCCKL